MKCSRRPLRYDDVRLVDMFDVDRVLIHVPVLCLKCLMFQIYIFLVGFPFLYQFCALK